MNTLNQLTTMAVKATTLRTQIVIINNGREALDMIPTEVVLRDYNVAMLITSDIMHPLEAIEIGYEMSKDDFNEASKWLYNQGLSQKEITFKLFDLQMVKNA